MHRLIIVLVFILSEVLFPQDWEWQNPLPQGNSLNDIQSINSNLGFACGDAGTILKTNTAGLSWQLLNFPADIKINSIDFLDDSEGWAAGIKDSTAYVFQTVDGGNSWEQKFEEKASQVSIFFLNKSNGWVSIDSILYFSDDGGKNWSAKKFSGIISSIFFLNTQLGWLTAGRKIYKTIDNGINWESVEIASDYFTELDKVEFIDSLVGFVSVTASGINGFSGHLFKSADGGTTWEEQLSVGGTFYDYRNFSDFQFFNKNIGWAVSEGQIFKTYNGTDWSPISNVQFLRHLTVIDSLTLWGDGILGSLYISTDGGYNWNESYEGVISETNDLQLLDKKNLFAAGGQNIFKTSNGGEKWTIINVGDFNKGYSDIRAVWFSDSLNGWISVENLGAWGGLYRTTDGGMSWSVQLDSLHRIFDIFFIDDSTGWYISGDNTYRTDDAGNNWIHLTGTKPDAEIESIYFVSSDIGFSGGYLGFYKTTNGGEDWAKVNLNIHDPFIKSIFFIDDQTGWATGYQGNDGLVLKTTDGGLNWNVIYLPKTWTYWPQSISFANKNNGWVTGTVGFTGTIFHSLDGGESWDPVRLRTESSFMRVVFPDTSEGWLLGDYGVILHTSNGGVTFIDNNNKVLPTEYFLYQNYPNPFNPSTKIKFAIYKSSFVNLKVYDILGREVTTLVNDEKHPGNYEVEFSARGGSASGGGAYNLSSGIYFYVLNIGNKILSKKMCLLK